VTVAGTVNAGGAPLAVMDIGAAQDLFGAAGQLSRIDLRLLPGTDRAAFIASLQLPPGVTAGEPGDAAERVSNLSRAYRVNLTVLALVALFTGAFLVFSVLSLSVARRAQQFALLGVLGLTPRERLRLVLVESLLLGVAGSAAGIALGTSLAALALRLLGGDLGGGFFAGVAPPLQWDGTAALLYGLLGVAAAGVGGWWPARAAQHLPPAQTLKGLGAAQQTGQHRAVPLLLITAGVLLAMTPPVFGIPLAAYVSVGLLLVGGITALPWLIALGYDRLAPRMAQRLLPMLAVERARRVRESAAVAVSGVVASLSLAVALTVMVASFRDSVTQWLDVVLPADLYVRTALATGAADTVYFPPELVQAIAQLPGVKRVGTQRFVPLQLDPARPAVLLISRPLDDPTRGTALVGEALPVPEGRIGIWVSEAMVDLYGARPGSVFQPLSTSFSAIPSVGRSQSATFFVAGVWRDYARQSGAIIIDRRDYERLTGDRRVNDLALWLSEGADPAQVQVAVRRAALPPQNAGSSAQGAVGLDTLLEFASASQIRATSLRIFDRSFAVTYWLQAVAIGIGLFGVAASFSAQVLARRKEFGLLAHLGLTRRQILTVVAGEGAAWTAMGALAGLGLGLAVSVVLVKVVNPQSFHWTMDLSAPWWRLLALCAAVLAAGTVTAWLAGRAAAGRDAVLAVKEDW
jgi:putative ABC transport system permease protein